MKVPDSDSSDDVNANDDFFFELDDNRNDNITLDEISTFVRDQNLDLEPQEIVTYTENIFKSLDVNGDKILHREDFKELWASIGSALSVEEVADWAEHAQQLPEEVAKEFAYHRITGYDFPELVEDDGMLLEKELGIARQGLKKRVLKSMKLILLGANQKPITPSHVTATTITCSRVKVDWDPIISDNLTFPIHKFVVERAVKDAYIFPLAPWNSPLPQHSWVPVCQGLETECEDWVPAGYAASDSSHRIFYRVTGWNVLGRSDRVVVAVNANLTDRVIPCPLVDRVFSASNSIINIIRTPSLMSLVMLLISLISVVTAGLFILLSSSSLKRRLRSTDVASNTSPRVSLSTASPAGIHNTSSSALSSQEFSNHSIPRSRKRTLKSSMTPICEHCSPTFSSKSLPESNTEFISDQSEVIKPTNQVSFESTTPSILDPPHNTLPETRKPILKKMVSFGTSSSNSSSPRDPLVPNEPNREDEFNRCSICEKPYKMLKWKWRVRHTCCYCSSFFCSNCGDFDHIELLPCKVPGSCCCIRCAVLKEKRVPIKQTGTTY